MKNLIIIGAGGFGREMFSAAKEALGYSTEWKISGFLDSNPAALKGFTGYPPIIGDPLAYEPKDNELFITALGSIASRRRCAEAIEGRGGKFAAIVSKSAFIGENVKIGEGSFVAHGVSITADVRIGRHVDIFHNSSIGHDTSVGDFSHIYAQCAIGGGIRIGDGASVYPGAVIVPRRRIGCDAVVGAGSTVFLDVPDGITVHGNPAKPIC